MLFGIDLNNFVNGADGRPLLFNLDYLTYIDRHRQLVEVYYD